MAKKRMPDFSADKPAKVADTQFYGYKLDEEQMALAEAIYSDDYDIIFCNAPAGTGKNLVTFGSANLLCRYGVFDEIIYIVSPYGERKQGYLPGDIAMKSSVYYEPAYQAMISCGINANTEVNSSGLLGDNKTGYITCITDTYLRGSNIKNSIVILDESQNFTVPQLKKVLTRVGEHTKVIVIGHDKQCDLDNPSTSGFVRYIEHFKDKDRAFVCTLSTNHRGWVSQWADELEE